MITICIGDASNDGEATASKASSTRAMENIDCRDISISDHEERDMHNDQDIVSSDNSEEFLENNSDDDTVSKHHKKVATYNYIAFHCKYAHCKS